MVHLMNKPKILLIVEGNDDKRLYQKLGKVLSFECEIFSVNANIHMLYKKIKSENFNINIVEFLKTLNGVSENDKNILIKEKKFAYIYLIFDYDPQHYNISKNKNIKRGIDELVEMVNYFNNETDPTIGKIYINYPMYESFFDIDINDFSSLKERYIYVNECSNYKNIINNRGIKTGIEKLNSKDLIELIFANINKASSIVGRGYILLDYKDYLNYLSQENILKYEIKSIISEYKILTLYTGVFLFIDYFGKDFYKKDRNF